MAQDRPQPPIGIDLGTTNSFVACFEDGAPRLIGDARGVVLTPSVVSEARGGLLVGEAARDRLATHPEATAAAFKRRMGTDAEIRCGTRRFRPEDLAALVLGRLKADAEADLGTPVRDVVVSAPAYFNQPQREATARACALAGLSAVRLVNEPTAAALAYGLEDRGGESQFLVFDLGGGTFDVTVLDHFEGVMEVRASSGDAFLGGEDFTEALARVVADRLGEDWPSLPRADQAVLRLQAEALKRRLTATDTAEVTLTLRGEARTLAVDRAAFEAAAAPLVKRLLRPIERCLYGRQGDALRLDRVILVGGATRVPFIRAFVARQFRVLPEMSIDPDHAVALGAAVQAALVAEDRGLGDLVMTDVSPFSIGIAVARTTREGRRLTGYFRPIIERNTPLPASREEIFATIEDGQRQITVEVFQGEAAKVADNVALGRFEVAVPPAPTGEESVAIRLTSDTSGLIEADARVLSTGRTSGLVIRGTATGLAEAELPARLRAMARLKLHPREAEENVALLARLGRLCQMTAGADRERVVTMMAEFEAAVEDQDPARIEALRGETGRALDRIDDVYGS